MIDSHDIAQLIQAEIDAQSLGGAVIRIVQDGALRMNRAFGADARDSIYRVFSMTKVVTAVATLALARRGALDLTAPVAHYIEEFAERRVLSPEGRLEPESRPVAIQDLLNMTSGIPYPGDQNPPQQRMAAVESDLLLEAERGQKVTTLDLCRRMAEVPGLFEPGTRWAYGASADLLGGVLEVASGMSLSRLFDELIFTPLGMNETGFFMSEHTVDRASAMFHRSPVTQVVTRVERTVRDEQGSDSWMLPFNPGIDVREPHVLSGGGGLYSTAADMTRLHLMLLNEGTLDGARVLEADTVRFLRTPQLSRAARATIVDDPVGRSLPGYSYANLCRILDEPERAETLGVGGHPGEFGWDGAGGNFGLVDPHRNLVAVFMMHAFEGSEPILRRKLYRAICR